VRETRHVFYILGDFFVCYIFLRLQVREGGMKRRFWVLCAVSGCLAWGQGTVAPGAASKPASGDEEPRSSAATAAPAVAMDEPVLTIKGFCPEKKAFAADAKATCETVITREQFEKIATAIRPNMTASVKQQLASLYPRLLVMSHAAEEMGLDRQSPYDQMIAFSRMQILTQGLTRQLQQSSHNVTEQEIADYYRKNPEMFDEYTLERLVVPLRKQSAAGAAQPTDSEAELTEMAEKLRARAAAGEDFLKLQKEAFAAAGVTVASPNTNMGTMRRSALPGTHTGIFQLKVGEVSPVISDGGGRYIYKLEGKDHLALEKVKEEIRQTLESQEEKQSLDRIQKSYSTEMNPDYFGTPASKRSE
jgi:hypothetical protein